MRKVESWGPTTQKILVLLAGGIALGLTRSPRNYFYILRAIPKEFERIDRRALQRAIRILYSHKLIAGKDNANGTTTLFLTDKGKKKALAYHIDEITIPPMKKWDSQWRIVIFDIPERFKKARNALSLTLKKMGFYPLQKSVFVHPFECADEIDFVIEFWNMRPYVRLVLATHIDNELHLKNHFGL